MDEKIEINGKVLQYGVLSDEKGYQIYVYPGMTVAEIAFNMMVTIKLLQKDGYIKSKKEFDALTEKYFNDPQYAEVNAMKNIQVKILDHNLNGMAKFLAMLTQRGHQISSMTDLTELYDKTIHTPPSKRLLSLPHTTIKRMNYLTLAIVGLSTKAVSQIRTHATRLTFVSTSTQYSSYESRENNWTMPAGLNAYEEGQMKGAYQGIEQIYRKLIEDGVDKDKAGYILPQGLRKALIISGNLDAWQYMISLRLCKRNTLETQHTMRLIYDEIGNVCGPEFRVGMLPPCANGGKCKEGKFSCGRPLEL